MFLFGRAFTGHHCPLDHSVKEKNYETQIQKLLMKAVVLDHSKSPCDEDFLPTDDKADSERAYLVFIKMVHSKDYSTWLKMASCFGEYPTNQLLMNDCLN